MGLCFLAHSSSKTFFSQFNNCPNFTEGLLEKDVVTHGLEFLNVP